MCVDGEGMPKHGNPFDKGRLFVLFTIVFPPNYSLGDEQAKLLEACSNRRIEQQMVDSESVSRSSPGRYVGYTYHTS